MCNLALDSTIIDDADDDDGDNDRDRRVVQLVGAANVDDAQLRCNWIDLLQVCFDFSNLFSISPIHCLCFRAN